MEKARKRWRATVQTNALGTTMVVDGGTENVSEKVARLTIHGRLGHNLLHRHRSKSPFRLGEMKSVVERAVNLTMEARNVATTSVGTTTGPAMTLGTMAGAVEEGIMVMKVVLGTPPTQKIEIAVRAVKILAMPKILLDTMVRTEEEGWPTATAMATATATATATTPATATTTATSTTPETATAPAMEMEMVMTNASQEGKETKIRNTVVVMVIDIHTMKSVMTEKIVTTTTTPFKTRTPEMVKDTTEAVMRMGPNDTAVSEIVMNMITLFMELGAPALTATAMATVTAIATATKDDVTAASSIIMGKNMATKKAVTTLKIKEGKTMIIMNRMKGTIRSRKPISLLPAVQGERTMILVKTMSYRFPMAVDIIKLGEKISWLSTVTTIMIRRNVIKMMIMVIGMGEHDVYSNV
mmetsp:Transcript_38902/g.90487  ORF Transcript_38902/g.90487 Transcript_38902/m.90487 type:complete len:412 (-) Transcript_38902:6846-8081(-)